MIRRAACVLLSSVVSVMCSVDVASNGEGDSAPVESKTYGYRFVSFGRELEGLPDSPNEALIFGPDERSRWFEVYQLSLADGKLPTALSHSVINDKLGASGPLFGAILWYDSGKPEEVERVFNWIDNNEFRCLEFFVVDYGSSAETGTKSVDANLWNLARRAGERTSRPVLFLKGKFPNLIDLLNQIANNIPRHEPPPPPVETTDVYNWVYVGPMGADFGGSSVWIARSKYVISKECTRQRVLINWRQANEAIPPGLMNPIRMVGGRLRSVTGPAPFGAVIRVGNTNTAIEDETDRVHQWIGKNGKYCREIFLVGIVAEELAQRLSQLEDIPIEKIKHLPNGPIDAVVDQIMAQTTNGPHEVENA